MNEEFYSTERPYAFRTFPPFGHWDNGVASAEWHEGTALEVGDRVSESYFSQEMYHAYVCHPYAGDPT